MRKKTKTVVSMKLNASLLSQANEAMRTGNFKVALELYEELTQNTDRVFAEQVEFNISLLRKKAKRENVLSRYTELSKDKQNYVDIDGTLKQAIEVNEPHFDANAKRAIDLEGPKIEVLKEFFTLDSIVSRWTKSNKSTDIMSTELLARSLKVMQKHMHGDPKLIVSVTHDNYRKNPGGVQLCVQREEQLAIAAGYLYVSIHPLQALPILDKSTDPLIEMNINGVTVGQCQASIFNQTIKTFSLAWGMECSLIIHSLLGHSLPRVMELSRLMKRGSTFYWLHDFFSICPSYALQRNNVSYCDSPPIDSNACLICIYGEERKVHVKQMDQFFSKGDINIISPSEVTLKFWKSRAKYTVSNEHVLPHRRINWSRNNSNIKMQIPVKTIRLAYVGGPAFHKGWQVFMYLIRMLANSGSFTFYHFGKGTYEIDGLRRVDVHVSSENYDAMIDAIYGEQIDFVLHWANWPETFSFTTIEAIAAGANVLTHSSSGNVAELVRKSKSGSIFDSLDELLDYLKSPKIFDIVGKIRARRRDYSSEVAMSDMSLSFIQNIAEPK